MSLMPIHRQSAVANEEVTQGDPALGEAVQLRELGKASNGHGRRISGISQTG
jgi:hypothetical protein